MFNKTVVKLISIQKYIIQKTIGIDKKSSILPDSASKVIGSFPEPNDYIDRSYFQYRCQKKRFPNFSWQSILFIFNVIAIVPLLYLLFLRRKSEPTIQLNLKNWEFPSAAFLPSDDMKNRIPDSILEEFATIYYNVSPKLELSIIEKKYILYIWKRFPLSFLFVFKCALKILMYASVINNKSINAIIATSEDSYTSSILTEYCHLRKIEHINIMHGEIFFDLSRTFFSFDRCYIWDEYYKELCSKNLRASPSQFIVELPSSLIYEKKIPIKTKYKYFLQNQNESQMKKIKYIMEILDENYVVRPHKIWTVEKYLGEIFNSQHIENDRIIDIEQSLLDTEYIVARDSTVLFQGLINNKQIIIDDVTDPERFKHLKASRFIILEKTNCILLSERLKFSMEVK